MANLNPQLITNKLLEKLIPSIESGEDLIGDFGLRVIKRDAGKIPDFYQSQYIIGLAEIVGENFTKAIEIHNGLVRMNPYHDGLWINFSIALGEKSQLSLAKKIALESIPYVGPLGLHHALVIAGHWADLDMMTMVVDKGIFDENVLLSLSDKHRRDIMGCKLVINELLKDEVESSYLSKMATLAMQIAEARGLPHRESSVITDAEGMLVFSYHLTPDYAEMLWELNDELASLIVDNQIFSCNSIATFHVRGD